MYTFMTFFSGKLQTEYALGTFGALHFTLIMRKSYLICTSGNTEQCEGEIMHFMSLYRECGSHNFAAADGHLPEVPSVLLQDSIEERWVQVCMYVCTIIMLAEYSTGSYM